MQAGGLNLSCNSNPLNALPYCNSALSPQERAKDLVARMTIADKASNLQNGNPGVPRLGVPPLPFSEALHGVVSGCGTAATGSTGCPTSFPHLTVLGSTFNRTLWQAVGGVISTEARALHNQGVTGLAFWAPDINLFRDPRWGRGQEVCGEDPFLNGEYIMNWAPTMQFGPDPKYIKTVATAKHFADYDLEGNYGVNRGSFNAVVDPQDQVAYYFPAFRAAVQGGNIQSIMCSYNAVNGMPSCGNDLFNNQIVRDIWGFSGFFVSDCGAINDGAFNEYIQVTYNGSAAYHIRQALLGGTDLECGSYYEANIIPAVNAGILNESLVDLAALRVYEHAIWLGLLEQSEVSYSKLTYESVDTPSSRQLALSAAQQGIVLLKNAGNILPLSKSSVVALIGPHANATQDMLSIYRGTNDLVNYHSPYQAIMNAGIKVKYAPGSLLYGTDTSGFDAAVTAAKSADVAVVFVGLHPGQGGEEAREDEGWDRFNITLPPIQEQLVQAIAATGKPVVVVLIHGGPLAIEWIQTNVPGILDAHYPGELGGDAIASVLFGDVSPSGRLTGTVYPANFITVRNISDMGLQEKGGITYQYYTGKPLWEFGFGLSYTTFSYKILSSNLNSTTTQFAAAFSEYYSTRGSNYDSGISYVAQVTNTGKVTSDVVVLGFVSSGVAGQPLKELFNFERVSALAPGASTSVKLSVPPQVLSQVDKYGTETIQPGVYKVQIGDPTVFAQDQFTVTGLPQKLFTLPTHK
jgi:beta-glucosidase-like glycosyl hydrolase